MLVACAARKLDRAAPARDLYVSTLFRLARAVAEKTSDRWFVLSARHGLVDPGRVLRPYDLRLTQLSREARAAWAEGVARRFDAAQPAPSRVVILAGLDYREPLARLLVGRGHRVEAPLAGLGIGRQQQALKRMAEEG